MINEETTIKYVIKCDLMAQGIVEKPDVVGAIFGQLEGLLGKYLELRELQKTGRIGRIDVKLESKGGKTNGMIMVPSSLGKVETAIIAAALETIDKIGPCTAKIRMKEIVDVREIKREAIKKRAIEILQKWNEQSQYQGESLIREIEEALNVGEIISFGEEKLPAGPDVDKSREIIVVEGRADVINLLRHGIKNAIAVEGTSVPKTIVELSKNKEVTAFVDGDRGGSLILKELFQVADIDYVARAPQGKGVEELDEKEITEALKNRVNVKDAESLYKKPFHTHLIRKEPVIPQNLLEKITEAINEIGRFQAILLDKNGRKVDETSIDKLKETIPSVKPETIVFDGIITQRIVETAYKHGVKRIIGVKKGSLEKIPVNISLLTFDEVRELNKALNKR